MDFGTKTNIKENRKINEIQYLEAKSSIQNFELKELPTQILSFFGGPFRNDKIVLNGNLNNSSERTITGTKMIKVTLTQMPDGTFYIKNFVGETYKNNKWSEFSLSDLEKAAAILKGKKVADNVRVMVVPATQKIFLQCIQKGLAEIFVEAGCAFNTPSCGPCMGGHMGVMAKGEKCVSTTNRNFVGRMGDTEALIYLASPQVAAASAIAGYIANPEKVGKE